MLTGSLMPDAREAKSTPASKTVTIRQTSKNCKARLRHPRGCLFFPCLRVISSLICGRWVAGLGDACCGGVLFGGLLLPPSLPCREWTVVAVLASLRGRRGTRKGA